MNLQRILSKFSIDKLVLFLSIIAIIGLYYEKYLFLIKPAYAILFFGFIRRIIIRRNLVFYKYIFLSLAFLFLAYASTIWSYNPEHTNKYFSELIKAVLLSIMIINICDSKEKTEFALFTLALSSLIFGLVFILNFDVSSFGASRISTYAETDSEWLPNVNVVGILVGFSFAYFITTFFMQRNPMYLLSAFLVVLIIILLGSRKTILNALLAILFLVTKLQFRNKFIIIFFIAGFIGAVSAYIPKDYTSFILERFTSISSFEAINEDEQERIDLINRGFDFISEKPLFGQGYYIFEQLYHRDRGTFRYSHNNYIETFVGLGLIGFILFYSFYLIIIIRVGFSKKLDYRTLIFILVILNLFDQFAIVLSNLRFTWILLAILFAYSRFAQIEKTNYKLT